MIELYRGDDMAIRLVVDAEGAKALCEAFREALEGRRPGVQVDLGISVLTMKRRSQSASVVVDVMKGAVDAPTLSSVERKVVWVLGREDLESAIESLERAAQQQAFLPAEFLRVKVPKNKKLDYIYGEYHSR